MAQSPKPCSGRVRKTSSPRMATDEKLSSPGSWIAVWVPGTKLVSTNCPRAADARRVPRYRVDAIERKRSPHHPRSGQTSRELFTIISGISAATANGRSNLDRQKYSAPHRPELPGSYRSNTIPSNIRNDRASHAFGSRLKPFLAFPSITVEAYHLFDKIPLPAGLPSASTA